MFYVYLVAGTTAAAEGGESLRNLIYLKWLP